MCGKSVLTFVLALLLVSATMPAQAELVGYWRLNEGAGTMANDTSGKDNHGALMGGPEWGTGVFSGALDLDGVDDFVQIPHSDTLTVDTEVTVMAWINAARHTGPEDAGWQGILGKGNSPRSYSLYTNSDGVFHFSTSGGSSVSNEIIPLNEWVHAVAEVADGQIRYYMNGELVGDDGVVTSLPGATDTTDVVIGKTWETNREFQGMIDDVRIYNHGLTEAEILEAMENPIPYYAALLVAPVDGGVVDLVRPTLKWVAGDLAVSRNLYFGESFEAVTEGQVEPISLTVSSLDTDDIAAYANGLTPAQTYYWRVDEIGADGTVHEGPVWSFTVRPQTSWRPTPPDGEQYVLLDQQLSWEAGIGALFRTVYIGTSFDEVNEAVSSPYMITTLTLDPGALDPGTTYYWRVDESTPMPQRGQVWSFTTIPDITVTDPDLVGWWTLDEGTGTTAVDWSGHGCHGALMRSPEWTDGYQGGALRFGIGDYVDCGVDTAADITDDFTLAAWAKLDPGTAGHYGGIGGRLVNDGGYFGFSLVRHSSNVYRLWVGNGTDDLATSGVSSDVQYTDTEWHHVTGVREDRVNALYIDGVKQASTTVTDMAPSTQFFHIGRQYSHLDDRYFRGSIDDVRIYNKALTDAEVAVVMRGNALVAGSPSPSSGAIVDIRDVTMLSWTAGDGAVSHDVYFGTDRDALELQGNQPGTSLSLAGLVEFGGGEYFWRVDEVASDGTVQTGYVWRFTVPAHLIVDDFEAYDNNVGSRVFETWVDGYGYTLPEPGDPGNGTGSAAGYDIWEGPQTYLMETAKAHTGQALPLRYDNSLSPFYSELERTWATAQNWTIEGVTDLTLYVRGDADNADAPFYVALQDSAGHLAEVTDSSVVMAEDWVELSIPLTDFTGVNAASVKKMFIGVGSRTAPTAGGSGVVFVDDIVVE